MTAAGSASSGLIRWVGLAIVAAVTLVFAAVDDNGPRTDAERIQVLSESFACPECDGQSVAESNAAVASTIRDDIRIQVNQGATDDQIRDRLVASYGSDVLLTPPAEGVSALIWILPVVVVVFATGALVVVLRRGRGQSRDATASDIELVREARAER